MRYMFEVQRIFHDTVIAGCSRYHAMKAYSKSACSQSEKDYLDTYLEEQNRKGATYYNLMRQTITMTGTQATNQNQGITALTKWSIIFACLYHIYQ